MKPLSNRERVMLICLPTFLIFAVYGWFLYPGKQLQQSSESLRVAQAKEPSLMAFAEKQVEIKQLDRQLSELEETHAELQLRRQSVTTPRVVGSNSQLTAIRDLTQLMTSHNLQLLDQGTVSKGEAELPKSLTQAAEKVAAKSDAKLEPVMWRVQFHGRYHDVLEVLQYLAESDHPAIPIQLLMDEVLTDTDWRAWTLVVWI